MTEQPDAPADQQSPLSLEAAQSALILRHTHLTKQLPGAQRLAESAAAEHRALKVELDQITRALKAYERIAYPRRRTAS